MQHINYISANLWATGWSDSIPTLFKVSYSVSFVHLLHHCKAASHPSTLPAYIYYAECQLYLCKTMGHWLVQQHTYTMYSVIKCIHCASNTYLHSCSPSGCSASMFTLCSISIISLQTCGPPAGPRAYTHYVRTQEVHPVMTSFTSANCGSSSHSANILYIHYEAHPLYLFKAVACQLLQQHTHTMQDVIKCILY